MKKIILSIILSLVMSPSFAEEVTVINQPEDQQKENHNVYSVVDENGVIQNNIVCADSVCGDSGSFNGTMPSDTPWAGMKLVKQRTGDVGGYWGTYNNTTDTN